MYQPKISVVIPAYNSEKFILQTLESVRDQDYGGIIETVVVDDCSKDGTAEAVRSFAETGNAARPVVFIQNAENNGVAATRNAGVKAASGDYICYLDSDDFWSEDKVSAQAALLSRYASGDAAVPSDNSEGGAPGDCRMPAIVCTAREMVDRDGKSLGKITFTFRKLSYIKTF